MQPIIHRQEALSRAYIGAVAAHAGIQVQFADATEYGNDGTFHLVEPVELIAGDKPVYVNRGYSLDFQVKSTINCRSLKTGEISYDCEQNAYNKLAWHNAQGATSKILLVFCMPQNEVNWIFSTAEYLQIGGACYWHYVSGPPVPRNKTIRLLPRHQLTPRELADIMNNLQTGNGKL